MKDFLRLPKWFLSCLFLTITLCCREGVIAQSPWRSAVLNYIHAKLAKPDGGYGWEDQPDSHLSPTYAVVGILKDLEQLPANHEGLIAFIKTHHPQRTANKETGPSGFASKNLLYDQIQSLAWLGADLSEFKTEGAALKTDTTNLYNYEKHNYGVFDLEIKNFACKSLIESRAGTVADSFINYVLLRRRANGSFNNAPAYTGGDGNILNTYWGLYALKITGQQDAKVKETADWLQRCQLSNGGFTHQPHPSIGGNDEVAYTWAAVKSLKMLSAKPLDEKACMDYLFSLRNTDGGFGNRPGLPSTPMSTFYAVDALKDLDAFSHLDNVKLVSKASLKANNNFSGLKVFTVQFQAQGSGSPTEAVMLADSLKINLWGAKNDNPEWINAAKQIASRRKVRVTFFRCDEPYGKNVSVEGMGTFGHILDYFSPEEITPPDIADSTSWAAYRKNFIEPLLHEKGALILQISNNEPMARMILDESVKQGGYAAISTIHFGQNFLFFLPYLDQYRYQLPYIALQDAHGKEAWWWSNEMLNYRTLFLGKEPTYTEMLKALKNNWVVAVRHDSISGLKTRMLGGAEGVQQYVQSKTDQWKWWNGASDVIHPWAAVTVVRPNDSLEAARPGKGVNIRVRCWRVGTRQIIKEPIVELTELKVDNVIVTPEYIEKKDRRGMLEDCYFLYSITEPSNGTHVIETKLRHIRNNTIRDGGKITFSYP